MAIESRQSRTKPPPLAITVVGAGIFGLWQALTLARAGHRVKLVEKSETPFAASASRLAGAMLAPGCESEHAPEIRDLGARGLALWREHYPHLINAGSLVVAAPREAAEMARFARATEPPQRLDADGVAALEPDLGHRFPLGFFFPDEAHMRTPDALTYLLEAARIGGASTEFGAAWVPPSASDVVIDCRGMAASRELHELRGVRGERLLLKTNELRLSRPVRLLHPRHPLYVVPWGDGLFLVGATVIESEDTGAITVRSALELLGTAFALNPAFGEAEIVETGAGIRPAFSNNLPRAEVHDGGRRISVNGAYRHGFLLAPVLAEAVSAYLANQTPHALLVTRDRLAHDGTSR